MTETYRTVPVKVGEARIRMEVRDLDGGAPIRVGVLDSLPFTDVTNALEAIGKELASAMVAIGPQKASVELGLEVAFEAGKLVALIANGSAKANLKVTLEWSSGSKEKT
jgi:hypothetical protein